MRIIKQLSLVILSLGLVACTSIGSKITASPNINPDINNEASPVAISIFELTDTKLFKRADFFSLYGNAKTTLGSTLLYEKNIVVAPGQTITANVPFVKGALYVGYIAAFRNLNNVNWRGVVAINPKPVVGETIEVYVNSSGLHVVPLNIKEQK